MVEFFKYASLGANKVRDFWRMVMTYPRSVDLENKPKPNMLPPANDLPKPSATVTAITSRYPEVDARIEIFESFAKPFREELKAKHPAFENFIAEKMQSPDVQIYIPGVKAKIAELEREHPKHKNS